MLKINFDEMDETISLNNKLGLDLKEKKRKKKKKKKKKKKRRRQQRRR